MTISASDRAADSDRLDRALELYRDLSVALADRITQLKAGTGDVGLQAAEAALKAHHRALADGSRDRGKSCQTKQSSGGAGVELDLDAARAEIVARLAVWAAAG